MKIALIGYGNMGHEIEKLAKELSIPVSKKINTLQDLQNASFDSDEIAIEFTHADAFLKNIEILCHKKANAVTGTTGWQKQQMYVQTLVNNSKIGFLYASNFSIGVNLFWMMLEQAAKLINNFSTYDILCHETHHKNKLDAPSGTAITMAKKLIQQLSQKDTLVTEPLQREIKENEIHISSTRGGYVFGNHTVTFDSLYDSISISHNAKNRQGFAKGAIDAAVWLHEKQKTGFFNIDDFIGDLLNA